MNKMNSIEYATKKFMKYYDKCPQVHLVLVDTYTTLKYVKTVRLVLDRHGNIEKDLYGHVAYWIPKRIADIEIKFEKEYTDYTLFAICGRLHDAETIANKINANTNEDMNDI